MIKWIRGVQKQGCEAIGTATDVVGQISKTAEKQIKKFDEKHGISGEVVKQGNKVKEALNDVDSRHDVSGKTRDVVEVLSDAKDNVINSVDQVAEQSGVKEATSKVAGNVTAVIKEHGLDKRLEKIGRSLEDLYGSTRYLIKPYFPPETPDKLLENTKNELAYISACIMQVSPNEANKLAGQFGTAVVSKITGVAASGALLSLVSTFGTAGTGTAIAGLSGAASTSASLAWVGSLLGGGMATGAVLTGGVALVVGLGAYKALSSEKRNFEELDEIEQRIVQYCWMLIAIIDEHIENQEVKFVSGQARTLLTVTLLPLQKLLKDNEEVICSNLDKKNTAAYRQHILPDFTPVIIQPFTAFIVADQIDRTKHVEGLVGGVLYALLTQSVIDDSIESQLILDALRRSDLELVDASESEISSYLSSYNEEQLKGIANNIKGIYHELLWVEQYNADHSDTRAELYEATNQPGADVCIVDVQSGDVIAEYQLKATDSVYYIKEHQIRYTDVEVIATNEVASRMDGVIAGGYFNEDITSTTGANIDALAANTLADRVLESSGLAMTIATGQELLEMLQGKKEFPEAVQSALKSTGTATAATAVTAYLFN
jgi:hypothetical protein